jgi:integrase/recombinase XerD
VSCNDWSYRSRAAICSVRISSPSSTPWLVHLLTRYRDAYASNKFRALQQFFRWLAEEEQVTDPMTRLRAPR